MIAGRRSPAVTVVVPTTGDRGPLLRHSVGSALAQTVADVEVFIVGDGMDAGTLELADQVAATDERVRVFPFPKHRRRGEPNRHDVLTDHARGRVVAYLCDRDLWLPDHLAELDRLLEGADFAHTLRFRIDEADRPVFTHTDDLGEPTGRATTRPGPGLVPLSFAGHTLDAYRRLPHGWRDTPTGTSTDRFMWEQFLAEPWVRVATSTRPTALSFKRGDHPGWSTARRSAALEPWVARLARPEGADEVRRLVSDALWAEWARLAAADRRRRGHRSGGPVAPLRRLARRARWRARARRRPADG